MKKFLSFVGALLLSTTLWAGGGIFEAWMTVQTNNENPVAYDVTKGISLGTINQGKMDSVFIKVWKDNGTDITNVWVACKIDGGEPMEIPCQWGKNLGGNDQEWNAKLDFNFLQGLADGDHKIELWAKAKTNKTNCDEFLYLNNDGKNYAMTFTKGTPAPVVTKYYITGNAALVGEEKVWNAQAIEMDGTTYTFTAMAAGEYEMKVTNGAWEPDGQSWGSAALSEDCSAGVGDKDGNIHFIVETPNNVVVSIAEGKVTVTGNFKPATPVETGYGIILGDGTTIKGEKNEQQTEYLEYMIVAELNANATFQFYNFANKDAWTESNIDKASTPNVTINANSVYEVTATGKYSIYLKMYGPENNQVYFGYEGSATGLNKVKAAAGQRYNILGQPVNETYRGIVIMNGKTYLQ